MRWSLRSGPVVLLALVAEAGRAQPPAVPPPTPAQPTVAATVNGEPIHLAQVDAAIRARLAFAPLTPSQHRQLRAEVLPDLVDDLLLKQFLRQHGPKVEPAEIDRQLKAFADNLGRKGKTLADYYKETNQTEASVREAWTTALQLTRYVEKHVTDDQLRKYYEANRDHFDRVEVRVSHVVIRVGPNTPPVEKAAAKEKLRALRADVLAGKVAFADAARKYSQCPSAPQGGDLGFIPRKGMLDEPFCRAAFALKVGDVSDVVETDTGVHLVRATDRKPGTPSTFEASVEDVREAFADEFRVGLVARLRKQAKVQVTLP